MYLGTMNHIANYLFFIGPIAALVAFLASLTIFFQPGAERYMKYFSIFLLVNFLLESAASYTALSHINNIFLNNMESLLVISFELYLLREIVASPRAKRIFLYGFLLYPVVAIINIFLVQSSSNFHTMTYSLGSLLIVIACIYYFWELFQQKSSVDLVRQPGFWICSGLLFFYCCTLPVYGLTNFIISLPIVVRQNLLTILTVINICLYLSFTIAYLCRLKIKRSMSTS
jgi:hypothetical protein